MAKKWMSSGYLQHRPERVDAEERVIYGVSVVTAGEAKGHGVSLDTEFVADVVSMGNDKRMGLKARFGHPNMCSEALGTYIGRFRNFRASEDGAQAFADLYLSDTSDSSPQGELGKYVMELAEKESDMFGTSIVFTPGAYYKRGEDGRKVYYEDDEWDVTMDPVFTECHALHACDAVDEPAANEGLFSASAYGDGEFAAKVTEFLDLNPGIFELAKANPEAIDEFIDRYEAYRNHNQGELAMPNTQKAPVEAAQESAQEEIQVEALAATESEPETVAEEVQPEQPEQPEALSELQRAVADFGAEIATEAFGAGEGYEGAQRRHYAALAAENEDLRKQLEAAQNVPAGEKPVEYSEGDDKPTGMPWRTKKN